MSRNERNPRLQLPSGYAGHSGETAGDKPEEGGDDVKSSWLLRAGLHTCYNGSDRGLQTRKGELISKNCLSSDRSLQLDCVKLESLVIADQHAAVNTFLLSRKFPVSVRNIKYLKRTLIRLKRKFVRSPSSYPFQKRFRITIGPVAQLVRARA